MRILAIDVGGSHVKVLATGRRVPIKIPAMVGDAVRLVEHHLASDEMQPCERDSRR